jgi:two-component system response regulator
MISTLAEKSRDAEILHVEDDDGVADLTREMFRRTQHAVRLHRARDGEDCLAFLRKEGPHASVPTPDIILLDLNLPRMDGREVMEEILRDEKLRHLPVVVLTTSADPEDVLRMYRLRCSSYIVKPLGFGDYLHTLQAFCNYWLSAVVLPSPR